MASVLKIGVFWQPSRLPVYPTAMSWIVDKTDRRKDFWPSEEGFMEIKKRRLKRSKESVDFNNIPNSIQNNLVLKTSILPLRELSGMEGSGIIPSEILLKELDIKSKSVPIFREKGSGKTFKNDLTEQIDQVLKHEIYDNFRDIKGSGARLDFNEGSGISGFSSFQENSGIETFSGLEISGTSTSNLYEESGSGGLLFENLYSYKTVKNDKQITEMTENNQTTVNVIEIIEHNQTSSNLNTSLIEISNSGESSTPEDTTDFIYSVEGSNIENSTDSLATLSINNEETSTLEDTENTWMVTWTASGSHSGSNISTRIEIKGETINPSSINNEESFTPSMLDDNVKERHCSSIAQCDSNLNERCVNKGKFGICQCGKAFIRNLHSKQCEAKLSFIGMLRCPNQPYETELNNLTSDTYRNMIEKSEHTLKLILDNCDVLSSQEAHIRILGFREGSLIIEWQLMVPESKLNSSLNMEADLEEEFINALQFVNDSPINVGNATFLNISSEANRCKNAELNYCSKNAVCLYNTNKSGGFECVCKSEYLDVSPFPINYGGEKCEAICPEGYCKNDGTCIVVQNQPVCKCENLYMGNHCQVSGLVLGFSCGVVIAVAFIILILSGKFNHRKQMIHYKDYELKESLNCKNNTEKMIQLRVHNHLSEEKHQFARSSV